MYRYCYSGMKMGDRIFLQYFLTIRKSNKKETIEIPFPPSSYSSLVAKVQIDSYLQLICTSTFVVQNFLYFKDKPYTKSYTKIPVHAKLMVALKNKFIDKEVPNNFLKKLPFSDIKKLGLSVPSIVFMRAVQTSYIIENYNACFFYSIVECIGN